MTPVQKEKWTPCMFVSFSLMSSEESECDSGDENKYKLISDCYLGKQRKLPPPF